MYYLNELTFLDRWCLDERKRERKSAQLLQQNEEILINNMDGDDKPQLNQHNGYHGRSDGTNSTTDYLYIEHARAEATMNNECMELYVARCLIWWPTIINPIISGTTTLFNDWNITGAPNGLMLTLYWVDNNAGLPNDCTNPMMQFSNNNACCLYYFQSIWMIYCVLNNFDLMMTDGVVLKNKNRYRDNLVRPTCQWIFRQ